MHRVKGGGLTVCHRPSEQQEMVRDSSLAFISQHLHKWWTGRHSPSSGAPVPGTTAGAPAAPPLVNHWHEPRSCDRASRDYRQLHHKTFIYHPETCYICTEYWHPVSPADMEAEISSNCARQSFGRVRMSHHLTWRLDHLVPLPRLYIYFLYKIKYDKGFIQWTTAYIYLFFFCSEPVRKCENTNTDTLSIITKNIHMRVEDFESSGQACVSIIRKQVF